MKVYRDISMKDAYKKADDVLLNGVRSIFDLVVRPGHINLDFADLKTAMSTRGYAMMGVGSGRGENRARQAAEQAIRSPLLDSVTIANAKGLLINVTGGEDVTFGEIEEIMDVIHQLSDTEQTQVFYGTVFDPDARDEISVTVIATGLARNTGDNPEPAKRTVTQTAATAPAAAVEEDDVPAIQRQQADTAPAISATGAARPTPMSIQDYLKISSVNKPRSSISLCDREKAVLNCLFDFYQWLNVLTYSRFRLKTMKAC